MDVCKDFLQQIRKKTLEDVYLVFYDDIVPNLYDFVHKLNQIKFEDGSYHTYYGEIRHVVNAFMAYFENTIDVVIKKADEYSNVIKKEQLLMLVKKTIDIQCDRHIFVSKLILPVCNAKEKNIYEELELNFETFRQGIEELKVKIERFNKPDLVIDFAREHFGIVVKKTYELFTYTHTFIALILVHYLKKMKISLEEIRLRMKNNLKQLQEERDIFLKELRSELYDKNKDFINMSRRDHRCSRDTAEVNYTIKAMQEQLEFHKYIYPIGRVTEELAYWEVRLQDFNAIADILYRLQAEEENVRKQQEIYDKLKTSELPGSKKQCWMNMGENFRNRAEFVQRKILEISKNLISFFAIPGCDHVMYSDNIGKFFLDPYNHQVYVFNHDLEWYHVECDGSFKEVRENDKYYFDVNGRYIKGECGEKIYQIALCTSHYKLGDDGLLQKITKNCGHLEKEHKMCRRQLKTVENLPPILPDVKAMNIKATLSPEIVKYLWDSFAHVLPEALHDVGRDEPRNPIHHLAHKLLLHKYSRTHSELWKKKKEANVYRLNILQERREKAAKASRAWKAKQAKRRKPEESDDTDQQTVYKAIIAAQDQMMHLYDEDD